MELKPGYKQTEVGVIPKDWAIERLGDLGKWLSGGTPSMSQEGYWNGDIPWISPKDMKVVRLHDSLDHVSEKALSNGTRLAPQHAVLVVVRGMILAHSFPVARAERALAFNQDIKALVTRHSVESDFILWWLQAHQAPFLSITTESTHGTKRMPSKALFAKLVALPQPAEQRAIAAALGDVDGLIAALDRLIAKKRDLRQAAMQQLLTGRTRLPGFADEWQVKRFGELFQFLNTANNPRADLSALGDVAYIHYGDIHKTTSAFLKCSEASLPLIAKERVAGASFVEEGDIVMVDASEDYGGIGKSVEVRDVRGRKIVAGLHTFLLRGNKELLVDGFKGYLQFIPSVKAALVRFAAGISVYGVSKRNVRDVEVVLPRLPEQTAIAGVLSDMDTEIAAVERRRDKTFALKQGMMQELLSGRTRLV